MRQLGRLLCSDLTRNTFTDSLDEILSTSGKVIAPQRSYCLAYERELRKKAIKLTKEKRLSIQGALWSAYRDDHRRMENRKTFCTLAN